MIIKKSFLILFILLISNLVIVSSVQTLTYNIQLGESIPLEEYQTEKFTHYTGDYSICEQDKVVIPVLLTNLENKENSFSLSYKGESWGILPKKSMLKAKQSGLMFLTLTPSEGSANTYILDINVKKDGDDFTVTKKIPVLIEQCYSLQIQDTKLENNACGCEEYSTQIGIINNGKSDMRLDSKLIAPEWLSIDKKTIDVIGNGVSAMYITGTIPCNITGGYSITMNLSSSDRKINLNKGYTLEVLEPEKCREAIILGKDEYSIRDNEIIRMSLKNIGVKQGRYSLDTNADWLTITPKILELEPNEAKEFILRKDYNLAQPISDEIKIIAGLDNLTYTKDITVNKKKMGLFNDGIVDDIHYKTDSIEKFAYFYRYYFYTGIIIGGLLFFVINIYIKGHKKISKKVSKE